jgi:hypothetical protein
MRRGRALGRRFFTSVAIGAVAVVAAGCGGSASLSHAQLVDRADAYCHSATERVAALTAPSTLSALAGYANQTRQETAQLAQELKGLKASGSDKQALGRYVSALEKGNALLSRIATAANAGEGSTVGSLGRELAAVPTATLASSDGLTDCAQSTATAD